MNDNDAKLTKLDELGELSDDEQSDRLHLERKVERAFYEAGSSLAEIRNRRLYRNTHPTFEEYCRDRFAFSRRRPYQLIEASIIVDNIRGIDQVRAIGAQSESSDEMGTIGTQSETDEQMTTNGTQTESNDGMGTICSQNDEIEMRTNGTQNDETEMRSIGSQNDEVDTIDGQILPTSERQVRPLTKLEPDQQREAWLKAVQEAGGRVPSGRLVKSVVAQMQEQKKVENPWRVGDVAKIVVKDNPELRGKAGCLAVITGVGDFSCTIKVWDGEYQVKPANLKDLPYSTEQQDEVKSLCDRLSKIKVDDGEKPVKDFLAGLGKMSATLVDRVGAEGVKDC